MGGEEEGGPWGLMAARAAGLSPALWREEAVQVIQCLICPAVVSSVLSFVPMAGAGM